MQEAKIKTFTDLNAWKDGHRLVLGFDVHKLISGLMKSAQNRISHT